MLKACGITDPGCVRENNEDSFLVAPELGLYLVADGMGGAQAGEYASRLVKEFIEAQINQTKEKNAASLLKAIEDANLFVMNTASQKSELEGMGTTIVSALEVSDGSTQKDTVSVVVASVGDSRAYLFEGTQNVLVTEDQTWINEVGRRLGMDEEALSAHPMRHVLTMAVGVSHPLRINQYKLSLKTGSQVLLSSDGLHGVVPLEQISEVILQSNLSLKEKCRKLIQMARDRGGPDNVTAVLLQAK